MYYILLQALLAFRYELISIKSFAFNGILHYYGQMITLIRNICSMLCKNRMCIFKQNKKPLGLRKKQLG